MTTNIYNYDGTLLTEIPDGSIDSTSTSIKIPGKSAYPYGATVNESILWVMQNFSAPTPPSSPINGQAWYDSTNKILKVYDSQTSTWLASGGVVLASSAPLVGSNVGSFWYNTVSNQLFVWNGTSWLLVGPLGASNNQDPLNPSVPLSSQFDAILVSDGTSTHSLWRITIAGTVLALISKDASFTPVPAISGFSTIQPGINFNTNITDISVNGDATIYRANKNNLPIANNTYALGSNAFKFSNVYSSLFTGTATSAQYADVAERYEADAVYSPGTLVVLGGTKEITVTSVVGNINVFGIVSTDPGIMLNADAGSDSTHPYVALVGRVPCKVVGAVEKGQRLMASNIPGVATLWKPEYGWLAIIGRAIENKTSKDIDIIEIVVGKN